MQRKKGDGSFRRLPNNSIEFTVSIGSDVYGSRKRKFFYGKTESECRRKYKEFMKGGETQPTKAKEYTLAKWLDIWLKTYKEKKVQASTYDEYVYLATHIKRHKIGKMKLSQVKPIHVTEFFSDLSRYSHSFRKRMRFLINGAFECAIDNDFLGKNPVRRAEIARKAEPSKEAFTESETKTMIEFAKTDELFGVPMYILFNTGIRSQEMRALTVDRINLENGIIKIDRAIKRTGELGKPKNGKARQIPLESDTTEFLKSKLQGKTGFVIGSDHFVTHSGFRGRYECFFSRLNIFLESKGENLIKIKSPHSTRHTFGTLKQKNGMPIAMVMELLGHSSLAMTEKYTHLGDVSVLSEAMKKYPLLNNLA
jgi:integrase